MSANETFRIATLPGDGIGHEIIAACTEVLRVLEKRVGGFKLNYEFLEAGADYYLKTGIDITDEAFRKVGEADAILLGAMGLPSVRYPDGTEISPHLNMRTAYGLYAGVRPVKAYPNVPGPLSDPRAANSSGSAITSTPRVASSIPSMCLKLDARSRPVHI